MTKKVLLVDDDELILHGYHRTLHRTFDLEVAMGGVQALQALEHHGPFAVLVADMRMPGMTGLDVLREAQRLTPDTTRIMLTGNLDQKTATDAVNEGQVFRFLTKPCPPPALASTIQAGLRQYQLVTAEKELLNQTLMGSLQILMDLLSNLDPETYGRGKILRERAISLARTLGCEEEWDLEIAALLFPLGRIALPPELLAKVKAGARLSPQEQALLDGLPETGSRLLQAIPRLEGVASIIRYHAKGFDGSGWPQDDVRGEAIPLGARILKPLIEFTDLEQRRRSRAVALEELALHPAHYDPQVLKALNAQFGLPPSPAPERPCPLDQLEEGMVLARSIRTRDGRPVLLAGLRLGPAHLELLRGTGELLDLQEPIHIVNG
jgi:response regulator RpfG family c-di-GMP phosphodiesterase